MSQWLILPEKHTTYKFTIRYQDGDQVNSYHHICYLELNDDNHIVVHDLIRKSSKIYNMEYEISSVFTPLNHDEINPVLNDIFNFLTKCSNKLFFEDYFSKDPYTIYSRNIKILNLLNLGVSEYIQNPAAMEHFILEKLKEVWIDKIKETKGDVLSYIDSEINKLKSDLDADSNKILEAYHETRQLADAHDYLTELNNINSIEELIEYWPVIFLPAPSFINELYNTTQ